MKITTLAKLAALGGAAYYVKKQGGIGPAFDKLKESMKGLADQAKPLVDRAADKVEAGATSASSEVGKELGSTPRFGSTVGTKPSY